MVIILRLQSEDSISFNKHMIGGVRNEHKLIVGISKVKNKGVHFCHSHSF